VTAVADIESVRAALKAFALSLPEAQTNTPWPEHDDAMVRGKTFVFLSAAGQPFSMSVKLAYTGEVALELPYAKPTGYGLGKSGWVSFTPSESEMPSLDQLREWVDESYRARAPRKLVKLLDERT
jgi:predicted DNA-binding protein (MmcQ/YjbR family)